MLPMRVFSRSSFSAVTKRILFVDDESKILDGIRRMLHADRKRWDMQFAVGGEAALQACESGSFDAASPKCGCQEWMVPRYSVTFETASRALRGLSCPDIPKSH